MKCLGGPKWLGDQISVGGPQTLIRTLIGISENGHKGMKNFPYKGGGGSFGDKSFF